MSNLLEGFINFNKKLNRLPQKGLLILLLLLLLFIAVQIFPYFAPFVLAVILAWMLNPIVDFLSRPFKNKPKQRKLISISVVLLVTVLLFFLMYCLVNKGVTEISALVSELPGYISIGSEWLLEKTSSIDLKWINLDISLEETIIDAISKFGSTLTNTITALASSVARGAWKTALSLPQTIISIILAIAGTYYFLADSDKIRSFLKHQLPVQYRERPGEYLQNMLHAIGSTIRAALIMLVINFVTLSVGFLILGVNYALILALMISVMDALPIIGAGLFLIPASLYGFIFGPLKYGIGFLVLYLLTISIRQVVEPKVVGQQLGLHPLATMIAMYVGLEAMGFLGMLLGPILLIFCKTVLSSIPKDDFSVGESVSAQACLNSKPKKFNKKKRG